MLILIFNSRQKYIELFVYLTHFSMEIDNPYFSGVYEKIKEFAN